jgi:hypothetical protein
MAWRNRLPDPGQSYRTRRRIRTFTQAATPPAYRERRRIEVPGDRFPSPEAARRNSRDGVSKGGVLRASQTSHI